MSIRLPALSVAAEHDHRVVVNPSDGPGKLRAISRSSLCPSNDAQAHDYIAIDLCGVARGALPAPTMAPSRPSPR
jgi:hypothetical protein